jgi:hypothetical protein
MKHQLELSNETFLSQNYESNPKVASLFIYLSSVAALHFVDSFEKRFSNEFNQNIVYITFDMTVYKVLNNKKLKAILCENLILLDSERFSLFSRLKYRWSYNKKILSLINKEITSNSSFLFFNKIIDYWGIIIARYLFFNNRDVDLIFLKKNHEEYKRTLRFSLDRLHNQIIDSLCYKVFFNWYKESQGLGTYLGVSDSFLIAHSVKILDDYSAILQSKSIGELANSSDSNEETIERLILGDYSISATEEFYSSESVIKIYLQTKKYFPATHHKYHPGKITRDYLSDSFCQLDASQPIELIDNKIKILIGGFSLALISMSLKGVKCVSYLNLVKIKDGFDREAIINNMLEKSKNKIHFPKTISEYLELLK